MEEKTITPLEDAFKKCRMVLLAVAVVSLFVNVLMLTVPLYMLQIYSRVLVSRSDETLIYLSVMAVGALLVVAALDYYALAHFSAHERLAGKSPGSGSAAAGDQPATAVTNLWCASVARRLPGAPVCGQPGDFLPVRRALGAGLPVCDLSAPPGTCLPLPSSAR